MGVDHHLNARKIHCLTNFIRMVAENDGELLDARLARRAHDACKEGSPLIESQGLVGTHATRSAGGENQSGDGGRRIHEASCALGL